MIISFSEALKILSSHNFIQQITNFAHLTFNQWFDTYYKNHTIEYPNAEHIADNFIKVAYGLYTDNIYEGYVYLDTTNDTIAGIITLNRDELASIKSDMFVSINNVFILPEYRGQGIAKALVVFLMDRTRKNRSYLGQINLFCEKHLISFYKSLGWKLANEPLPKLIYWYEMIWRFNKEPLSSSICHNIIEPLHT